MRNPLQCKFGTFAWQLASSKVMITATPIVTAQRPQRRPSCTVLDLLRLVGSRQQEQQDRESGVRWEEARQWPNNQGWVGRGGSAQEEKAEKRERKGRSSQAPDTNAHSHLPGGLKRRCGDRNSSRKSLFRTREYASTMEVHGLSLNG